MNSTKPRSIDDLPPELLSLIFITSNDSLYDDARTRAPPCVNISHTCSRWRGVALSCPELWSTVLPRPSKHWTEACLLGAPVSTFDCIIGNEYLKNAQAQSEYREATALVLSRHLRRARVLRLELQHPNSLNRDIMIRNLLDQLTMNQCPLIYFDFRYPHWSPVQTPIELPVDIFSSLLSSPMVNLTLMCCALPTHVAPHLASKGMRSLNLCDSVMWTDAKSMASFLQLIPTLEELSYTNERWHLVTSIGELSSVHLTSLRYLHIHAFWVEAIIMFACIHAPVLLSLSISCPDHNPVYTSFFTGISPKPTYVSMVREAFRRQFSSAIDAGSFYENIQLEEISGSHAPARILAVICDIRQGQQDSASMHLPRHFSIRFPTEEMVIDISREVLKTVIALPAFTQAMSIDFNALLWRTFPEAYELFTSARELRVKHVSNIESLLSALRHQGTPLLPTLSRVHVSGLKRSEPGYPIVSRLAEALCTAHAATDAFECMEVEEYDIENEEVDFMRRCLGADRVHFWPVEKAVAVRAESAEPRE